MQHPDEGTIHAWLDGALGAEEERALEAHVAGCAQCAAAVTEARGLLAASSRILSALDAVPGGVLPVAPPELDEDARVVPIARSSIWRSAGLRAAAAIVLVGSVSWLATRSTERARDSVALAVPPVQSSSVGNAAAAEAQVALRADTGAALAPQRAGSAARAPAKKRTEESVVAYAVPRPGAVGDSSVALRTAVPAVAPNAPVAPPSVAAGAVAADVAERREQVASAAAVERDAVTSQMRAKVGAQPAGAGRMMLRESAPVPMMAARTQIQCYVLDFGASANVAALLPRAIELTAERDPLARADEGDAHVLRAGAGNPPIAAGTRARWSTIGADSVLVEVSDAARSLVARLQTRGDSIGGRATVSGGAKSGEPTSTTIHGSRTACQDR